ncbi:MAG TPA: sulfatase-like hydrolase/transferase [Bacteroidia bacterium]|nr:sulfatase-like hydrolase/transferase [Bacteroidia bacterium]
MKIFRLLFILIAIACCPTCKVDDVKKTYKTKHVIVIVVDGARYSETFGDSSRHLITFLNQTLLPQGVMLTNFRNNGNTWTSAGHDAMCTGIYEPLDNGGNQFPSEPSIFQYWRKATGAAAEKAWVITSKDKLYVLANTADSDFQTKWMPRYDCGINGPFSGYRDDSTTTVHILDKLNQYHPDLVIVNFREPDYSGHMGVWQNYLNGISSTDHYISEIWSFLQSDSYYAGTTTLIVTNDHGRHLNGHLDGFVSHGDDCEGCRHIEFIAAGPDFKRNFVSDINYEQIDIPRTISELMGFPMPTGGGKVMTEIMR